MTTPPKTTGKKFSNVNDMVKAISKDSTFKKEFDEDFKSKKTVRLLASSRAAKGLTQSDLAKKIGCGQPRISKIENGNDSQLKLQDITDYATALDLQISAVFNPKEHSAVEEIKYHAFEIQNRLEKLADLAKKDDALYAGVSGFFGETLFNLLNIFESAVGKLPKKRASKTGNHFEISTDLTTQDKTREPEHCH